MSVALPVCWASGTRLPVPSPVACMGAGSTKRSHGQTGDPWWQIKQTCKN